MQGLILLSVLAATFAIPVAAARRPGRAAYGRVPRLFFLFAGVYVFLLLVVYPRLF